MPDVSDDLRALNLADSVAVDPHKWLYAPLEAGCALVRDAAALRAAFSYHPAYYHFDEQGINYVDYGPQNSRGFRALKVWLALKHVGADGYRRMIADDMALSRAMAAAVEREPELQLVSQGLSIATFRFVPGDLRPLIGEKRIDDYLNTLNEAVLDAVQRGGEAFVSNAVVGGRYVLRACIVNFHTSQDDVEAIPGIVVRVGRDLDARMRESTARRVSAERSVRPQRFEWAEPGRAASGQPARQQRDAEQGERRHHEDDGIAWPHAVEQRLNQTASRNRGRQANRNANERDHAALSQDHSRRRARLGAHRQTNTDLACSLRDDVRDDAVDADDAKEQRHGRPQ